MDVQDPHPNKNLESAGPSLHPPGGGRKAALSKRRSLAWIPPFLVGALAAVTLEVSAGLLLYSDVGFLPALTLVLSVESAAGALGIWTGALPVRGGPVEHLRRRWFFALVAFAIAAVLSGGRTLWAETGNGALAQGVSLAFLGALPLFALGSLLGAMGGREGGSDPPVSRVAVPAAAGLAAGFFATGLVLIPYLAPYSIFLACMVVLSGGALLQGWVLDRRIVVMVREEGSTPYGAVRVEDRAIGGPRRELRLLLEAGRLRGAEDNDGHPARSWETALLKGLLLRREPPGPALYLGGGSETLAGAVCAAYPGTPWTLTERDVTVFELASRYFSGPDEDEEVQRLVGDPFALLESIEGSFNLVILDAAALPELGGRPFLRDVDWESLVASTREDGVVVLGGVCNVNAGGPGTLSQLARDGQSHFAAVAVLETEAPLGEDQLLAGCCEGPEQSLVLGEEAGMEWLRDASGERFRLLPEG